MIAKRSPPRRSTTKPNSAVQKPMEIQPNSAPKKTARAISAGSQTSAGSVARKAAPASDARHHHENREQGPAPASAPAPRDARATSLLPRRIRRLRAGDGPPPTTPFAETAAEEALRRHRAAQQRWCGRERRGLRHLTARHAARAARAEAPAQEGVVAARRESGGRKRMGLEQQARDLVHRVDHGAAAGAPGESALQRLPSQAADLRCLEAERGQVGRDALLRPAPIQERPVERRGLDGSPPSPGRSRRPGDVLDRAGSWFPRQGTRR